ncbi:hypothetical protein ACLOJK_017509 [Asimina triloba]
MMSRGVAVEAINPLKVSWIKGDEEIKDGAKEVVISNGEAGETGGAQKLARDVAGEAVVIEEEGVEEGEVDEVERDDANNIIVREVEGDEGPESVVGEIRLVDVAVVLEGVGDGAGHAGEAEINELSSEMKVALVGPHCSGRGGRRERRGFRVAGAFFALLPRPASAAVGTMTSQFMLANASIASSFWISRWNLLRRAIFFPLAVLSMFRILSSSCSFICIMHPLPLSMISANTQLRAALKFSVARYSTINFSILETQLEKCRNSKHFKQIHLQMIISGLINDTYAASRLLRFSAQSGFVGLDYSHSVLDRIENPNGFIYNTMMRSYLGRNLPQFVMVLYMEMLRKNFAFDNYTYPILFQSCCLRLSANEGKEIHAHVLKLGFDSDVFVQNTLINMYAVCGELCDARRVFDESSVVDSVSWNSILAGYVKMGDIEGAMSIFGCMPEPNTIASNSMIALFGRTGRVSDARELFDEMPCKDVVSWSAMISCYEQNEMFGEALKMFSWMNELGIEMDEVVMVSVLCAYSCLLKVKEGEMVHGLITRSGFDSYVNLQNALIHMYSSCGNIVAARRLFNEGQHLDQISWNSMISGYLKCGFVDDARRLFDSMPAKDVISWSAMISGYAQHDRFSETLALFHEMQCKAISPDEATLVSVVSACAHLAALDQAKWVHTYIRKHGITVNVILGTTLIDMYMKFGCVENAMEVFHGMGERSVSSWNAVIVGLAMNGMVEQALEVFSEMKMCHVAPNEITFVGVLGACRHAGLVDEGRQHFDSMMQQHNIEPNVKHYGCMVDLLGRAGLLNEAEELIESMPMMPDVATWGALLGACRKHGNAEIGERVGRRLIVLEPQHDGFHVLLSNIYASKGRWDAVMEIRSTMKQQGVVKTPGCSLIEANGVVHEFLAGDRTHPQAKEIDKMLNEMASRLKMLGYEPETHEVALDIDEEEKETALYRHSEKLAIAFGVGRRENGDVSTKKNIPSDFRKIPRNFLTQLLPLKPLLVEGLSDDVLPADALERPAFCMPLKNASSAMLSSM